MMIILRLINTYIYIYIHTCRNTLYAFLQPAALTALVAAVAGREKCVIHDCYYCYRSDDY